MSASTLKVALLGFGVVGGGTAEVITENQDRIRLATGGGMDIRYILDLRDFPDSPFADRIVHDYNIILNDPEVDAVVEMMGGSHPAYEFTKSALMAGKHVVTSNKEVVANFGTELLSLAAEHGVRYLFEASVGGGIPIIRPMQTDLASNEILTVSGILNGTTNFILTKMKNEGAAFETVLKESQAKGYAEANPTADVEGIDAARKISILAALAYGILPDSTTIPTEGITGITALHTAVADKLGGAVKLIGHTERIDGKVYAEVSPYLVLSANPLSHVDDVFNGILVEANMLGRALFYGAGAGKLPTASAVVADIIDVLSHRADERKLPVWKNATADDIASRDDYVCRRCYLVDGCPKCAAKAKAALLTEECVEIADGRFAVVSAPMSAKAAAETIASTGVTVTFCIPVLE